MTRTLRKTIMFRLKLKNKHNKTQSTENWDNCKKNKETLLCKPTPKS